MDFGIFLDFVRRPGGTQEETFKESFDLVDLAEAAGVDTVWLGEMHFNPNRSVLSAPIIVACSIATRTKRLRVGMAVQVLPLIHPLRIAEEAATVDQISQGRFEFGVGRSGNVRAYDTMGIDYEESRERFQEALDIILKAWSGETFSYEGKYNHITNARLSPLPYQKPHPKVRIASTTEDSFSRVGRLGFPIFLSMRGMEVEDPKETIEAYFQRMRRIFDEGLGRPGTEYWERRQRRIAQLEKLTYEEILETKVIFGSPERVIDRLSQFKEMLGLTGFTAELNPGGLLPPEAVHRSLKLLTEEVMPAFK